MHFYVLGSGSAGKKQLKKDQPQVKSGTPPDGKSNISSGWNMGSFPLSSHLKDPKWLKALQADFKSEYFQDIENYLKAEVAAGKQIFPPPDMVFHAFNLTPMDKVGKVTRYTKYVC